MVAAGRRHDHCRTAGWTHSRHGVHRGGCLAGLQRQGRRAGQHRQVARHLAAVGIALAGFFGQRTLQQAHCQRRQRIDQLVGNGQRVVDMGVQNLCRGAGKRRSPDDAAIEDRAQRIEVRPPVDLVAVGALFGRHIGRRAHGAPDVGQFRCVERAGDAKIGEERRHGVGQCADAHRMVAVAIHHAQQYVARLDIAVHDAAAVGVIERAGDWLQQTRGVVGRQPHGFLHQVGQGRPFDQLHDDVGQAVVLAHVVDRHDVGVAQVAVGARFLAKAGAHGGVGVGQEHLHGDGPIASGVYGAIDRGHGAAAQPLDQAIGASLLTGQAAQRRRRALVGAVVVGQVHRVVHIHISPTGAVRKPHVDPLPVRCANRAPWFEPDQGWHAPTLPLVALLAMLTQRRKG
jgi:hypothetical protein